MKTCKICGHTKPIDLFHKETKGKLGRKSRCSECTTKLSQQWKVANSEREQENRKRWNLQNKERHKASTYTWRKNNQEAHNSYVASWQKKKKSISAEYKFLANVRSLVSNHFARRSICKTKHLESLLGIEWNQFYNLTINNLQPGMTVDNYGEYWSFDHTCPCSVAINKEELEKLQHWSNWKPMIHVENLSKQDSLTPEAIEMCRRLLGRDP